MIRLENEGDPLRFRYKSRSIFDYAVFAMALDYKKELPTMQTAPTILLLRQCHQSSKQSPNTTGRVMYKRWTHQRYSLQCLTSIPTQWHGGKFPRVHLN